MATLYGTVNLTNKVWGTTDEDDLGIIVETLDRSHNTEESTLLNGDGKIVGAAYHGENETAEVSFKVRTDGYPKAKGADFIGATITLADSDLGDKFVIQSVKNAKNQGEWMSGSMTLRRFGWDPDTGS
jgi:hypothetical protein